MSDYRRITDRKIELTDEGVEELMADYTPETSDVRANYVDGTRRLHGKDMRLQDVYDEFDRWLAKHDREVKAETLEKVANDLPSMAGWNPQEAATILLAQKRIRTYREGENSE